MFRLFRGSRYGDSLFLLLMRKGILIGCLIKTFAFLVSSDLRDSLLAGLILRQSSVTVIKNLSVPPSFLYYLRYSVFLTLEQELHSILAKFQCMYTRTRHCWWENSSVLYKNQTLCCGWKNPSVYTRIQYSVVGGRIPVCVYQNSIMSERSLCLYLRIRHSIVGGKIPLYVPESDILLWMGESHCIYQNQTFCCGFLLFFEYLVPTAYLIYFLDFAVAVGFSTCEIYTQHVLLICSCLRRLGTQ